MDIEKQFGDLTFIFDKYIVELTPASYLQQDKNSENPDGPPICVVGIIPMPKDVTGLQMMILGDTFLRHLYSVFDYEKKTVGLGLNKVYGDHGYKANIEVYEPMLPLIYYYVAIITCIVVSLLFLVIMIAIQTKAMVRKADQLSNTVGYQQVDDEHHQGGGDISYDRDSTKQQFDQLANIDN